MKKRSIFAITVLMLTIVLFTACDKGEKHSFREEFLRDAKWWSIRAGSAWRLWMRMTVC